VTVGEWEAHAAWWQANYTDGVDVEYTELIVPRALAHLADAAHVVDIGAGEGQVARALVEAGCSVVAVDPAGAQVGTGARRGGGLRWVRGEATRLPVRSSSMDGALCCLVIEHVGDLDAVFAEASRVLRPHGRFVVMMNHPLVQTPNSGWIDDRMIEPPEQYWRLGSYLGDTETVEEVESGVFVRFWHRPLSRYVDAAADVGFVVERIEEPPPPDAFLARAPEYVHARSIPRLMVIRFRLDPR
jgi:SAM-dependent methyltransferase